MAAISVTYTFVANTTANSGEVNQNFSDLVNYINNRNSGSATWDSVYATSSSINPVLRINNSTGTNNIANFQDNGTNVMTIADGGAVVITATAGGTSIPLTVNNNTSTGSILILQDNGSAVLTVADGGIVTSTGVHIGPVGAVSAPTYSFTGLTNYGMYTASSLVKFAVNGTERLAIGGTSSDFSGLVRTDAGTAAAPSYSWTGDTDTGMYNLAGNTIAWVVAGGGGDRTLSLSATDFEPFGAGTLSTGNASNYWNDISYKTLTDRGCLPWADDGVELQDGTFVSDAEALSQIRKHPTKLTVHGLPMLDYSTFPKVSYVKASVDGRELPRDEKGEPIGGSDGVEMTSVFGFMIGSIKELHERVKALEA